MADTNGLSVNVERQKCFYGNNQHWESLNLLPTSETIRILLFKECRFTDRQLIFDSHLSHHGPKTNQDDLSKESRKHSEEFSHLTEMIFGSTAMKYHDTYYKIHDVSSPDRFIFTQVFSTPKQFRSETKASFNQSNASFPTNSSLQDYDSFASSLSQTSLDSKFDSFSLIRKTNWASPNSTSSTIDSGFSESSFSSNSSYGSLSRRRSNTSSTNLSMCGSFFGDSESSQNLRYSRLGLALIVHKPSKNENNENIFIQNITLIESILWRVRQYIELALNSPRLFLSTMLEVSLLSAKWLSNELFRAKPNSKKCSSYYGAIANVVKNKLSMLTFSKSMFFKRCDRDVKFEEFCQTLEELEVKETKLFLSTLLTAVLTHHTGWVATCYQLEELSLNDSYHAVWNQLTNLFGATGYLTKTSKTVIYGLKNDTLIKRVLDFLSYFLRYFRVQKRYIERDNILEEKRIVDEICDGIRQQKLQIEPSQSKKPKLSKIKTSTVDLAQMINLEEEKYFYEESNNFDTIGDQRMIAVKSEPSALKKKGISKIKAFGTDLFQLSALDEESNPDCDEENQDKSVLFILGDNEKLQNLKNHNRAKEKQHTESIIEKTDIENIKKPIKLKVVKFPLPKMKPVGDFSDVIPNSYLPKSDSLDDFIPDKIVQGSNITKKKWKNSLINELSLKRSCIFPHQIEENVAILGDTDKWDVQIWSSSRQRMVRNKEENNVDPSTLVSSMLDILLQMIKLKISREQCTTFIEQKLIEICLRANALTQFLLTTDFCTMDMLLSTLNINVVDVPLLMSVGSNINPTVLQKYGLSYQ